MDPCEEKTKGLGIREKEREGTHSGSPEGDGHVVVFVCFGFWWSWGLKLGLPTCYASVLPTELYHQPWLVIFYH